MIELKKKRISNSFSLIYKAAKKQNKTKAKKTGGMLIWDFIGVWHIWLLELTSYGRTIGSKTRGGCHSCDKDLAI